MLCAQPAAVPLLVEVMADDGGCRFGSSCSQCAGQGVVAACVGNRRAPYGMGEDMGGFLACTQLTVAVVRGQFFEVLSDLVGYGR